MMGTTVRHESLFPIGLDIRPGGCLLSTKSVYYPCVASGCDHVDNY